MELARQLEDIDQLLLDAVPGQDNDIADWMEVRRRAVQALPRTAMALAEIDAIQQRTTRLEEKFLHWRRSSIMELSLLEQHLRFLSEQQAAASESPLARIDIHA